MAKRGKKGKQTTEPKSNEAEPQLGLAAMVVQLKYVLLASACLLVYLALFYSAPLNKLGTTEPIYRHEFQWFLLTDWPYFFDIWSGGDWSQCTLVDRLPVIAMAAIIVATGWSTGRLILELLRIDERLDRLERIVFSTAVGLNVWSLLTLAIGLAGGLGMRFLFFALIAASLIAAMIRQKNKTTLAKEPVAENEDADNWLSQRTLFWIIPFAIVILLGSMLPPRAFDVREYHLQVPKEWFQNGEVSFMPHNIYGNMPLGSEMHAVLAMVLMDDWWWGAIVGKSVMGLFAPLTALTLFAMGRRLVGQTAGVIAALVYISIPWTSVVSMHGLNEGAYGFYFVTAVYAILLWHRNEKKYGELLLAGFLAGSAVACKYPAILFVVIPLLVFIVYRVLNDDSETERKPLVRCVAFFSLAVCAACGLWLMKNWVLTGNPTYPMLSSVFGGETLTAEKIEQWNNAHAVPGYSLSKLAESFTVVFYGEDLLSPLVFPLAILALFVPRSRDIVVLLVAIYCFTVAMWWGVTHRLDRFLVPVLPIVSLLAGIGFTWAPEHESSRQVARRIMIGFLAIGLICNFTMITSRLMVDVRFFVALDVLRKDHPAEYQPVPTHIYPSHRILNENASEVNRVLMVGGAEPFDLEVPVLYNTCFDECNFTKLLKGKSTADQKQALSDAGISHVLVNWNELNRYRTSDSYGYSSDYVQPEVFAELVAQGVLAPAKGEFSSNSTAWQIFVAAEPQGLRFTIVPGQ